MLKLVQSLSLANCFGDEVKHHKVRLLCVESLLLDLAFFEVVTDRRNHADCGQHLLSEPIEHLHPWILDGHEEDVLISCQDFVQRKHPKVERRLVSLIEAVHDRHLLSLGLLDDHIVHSHGFDVLDVVVDSMVDLFDDLVHIGIVRIMRYEG